MPSVPFLQRVDNGRPILADGAIGTLLLGGASIDALRVVAEAVL